jgi:hypothetical protein
VFQRFLDIDHAETDDFTELTEKKSYNSGTDAAIIVSFYKETAFQVHRMVIFCFLMCILGILVPDTVSEEILCLQ